MTTTMAWAVEILAGDGFVHNFAVIVLALLDGKIRSASGAAHLARGPRALTALGRLDAAQHSPPGRGNAAGAIRNQGTEMRLRAQFPASGLPAGDMGLCYTCSKQLVESSR